MEVEFQRRVDRIVGGPLCRLLSSLPGSREEAAALQPKRVLVILLSEMGALVLARPMFQRIREKYPQAILHALVFRQNKEVLDLLDVMPAENLFTIRNTSLAEFAKDSLSVLRTLRRIGIDTVIDCELFSRISSILSFLSGATIRVGFHPHTQEGLYRGDFINRPVLYNPYQHTARQFLTLVEAIGAEGTPRVKRAIEPDEIAIAPVPVGKEEIETFWARLRADFPKVVGTRLVLVYPGGGLLPIRAWPVESFSAVAAELARSGYSVGVIGLREDHALAQRIVSHCGAGSCIDLTGYTRTVRELLALFHLGSLLVTNDGGPGHFASLTPIPAIVLFGPETPTLYGALGKGSVNLFSGLSCSPCLTAYNHRKSPCDGNNVCLKSIPPATVLAKSYEILGEREGVLLG